MKKFKLVFLGMMFLLVSLACVITVPVPGAANPPAATLAESVTPSSTPSRTPVPSITAFPTPTRRATLTVFSTIVAEQTVSPPPSLTPAVAIETVEGGIGTTPTRSGSGSGFFNISPTPPSLKCKVELVNPAFGEDIKPRTDFMAIWRLYNVGTAPWASGEFVFEFVEGTKLHSRDNPPQFLTFTVYVKDRVKFDIRMKSPKEPGRYTTTWGMRRVNKKEPFCTFSLTIDVVK